MVFTWREGKGQELAAAGSVHLYNHLEMLLGLADGFFVVWLNLAYTWWVG